MKYDCLIYDHILILLFAVSYKDTKKTIILLEYICRLLCCSVSTWLCSNEILSSRFQLKRNHFLNGYVDNWSTIRYPKLRLKNILKTCSKNYKLKNQFIDYFIDEHYQADEFPAMGRFTIRNEGKTIAMGIIKKIIE